MEFIPYKQIRDIETLVVDGQHKGCVKLSHWRGAGSDKNLLADTSAEIVLNAIKSDYHALKYNYVSATHFDIDGLTGVWSAMNPDLALNYENILKQAAQISDFRELDLNKPQAEEALKLVCYVNKIEIDDFYPPFGRDKELDECVPKFRYFLDHFSEAIQNINKFEDAWKPEFTKVMEDYKVVQNAKIEEQSDIGLVIIELDNPIHYYSLFSKTIGFDNVLTIYPDNKYEFEYKYTTWVDLVSRLVYPRIKLDSLIDDLNSNEESSYKWFVDRINDAWPIMRLVDNPLSKLERFESPFNRPIFSSSIEASLLKEKVISYFKSHYSKIDIKTTYAWGELKEINSNLG